MAFDKVAVVKLIPNVESVKVGVDSIRLGVPDVKEAADSVKVVAA